MIKIFDISEHKSMLDVIASMDEFSAGADAVGGQQCPSGVNIITEIILDKLGKRYDTLTIKRFHVLNDQEAYDWHLDNTTTGEADLACTALVYLTGCCGTIDMQVGDGIMNIRPAAYSLVVFDNSTKHRAGDGIHQQFLKFTFVESNE